MSEARYWIGVASRDHVLEGIAGGFAQFCHGKRGPASRPRRGDGLVYYSPQISREGTRPCQAFTALGRIQDDVPTQIEQAPGFFPYRRQVAYFQAEAAPIRPLLPELSFIRDQSRWGMTFRFGFLEIPAADFARIAAAMGIQAEVQSFSGRTSTSMSSGL